MPINFVKSAAFAVSAGLLCAGAAAAQEAGGPSFGWSVTGATDYVWRGASQTSGDPSVFIAGSASWGEFYAGAGAEHVDFGAGSDISVEYDFWAGWAKDIGFATLDLGVVRYGYLDGEDLDTLELKAGLSRGFGAFSAGATVYYTDDYFGNGDAATYFNANAGYAINDQWSVSADVGRQEIDAADDGYTNWNVGVAYAPADNVSLGLTYHDTDVHEWGGSFDSGLSASFSVSL